MPWLHEHHILILQIPVHDPPPMHIPHRHHQLCHDLFRLPFLVRIPHVQIPPLTQIEDQINHASVFVRLDEFDDVGMRKRAEDGYFVAEFGFVGGGDGSIVGVVFVGVGVGAFGGVAGCGGSGGIGGTGWTVLGIVGFGFGTAAAEKGCGGFGGAIQPYGFQGVSP